MHSPSLPVLPSYSTSAMSLLYECVNTVIAGQCWYSVCNVVVSFSSVFVYYSR